MNTGDPKIQSQSPSRAALAFRLLKSQLRALGWRYIVLCLITALFALTATLPPKLFVFFSNGIAQIPLDTLIARDFLSQFFLFSALVAGALFISSFGWTIAEEWIFLTVEANLRRKLLSRIHDTPIEHFDSTQRGEWLTRMSTDLRSTESFITTSIPNQMRSIITLAIITYIFATHDFKITLALLVAAAGLMITNVIFQRKLNPILERLRTMHGDIFQALLENYEGLRTIRSLRAENQVAKNFDRKIRAIISKGLRVVQAVGLMMSSNTLFTSVMTAFCLTAVAWNLKGGAFTLAEILSYPFYLGIFCGCTLDIASGVMEWNRFFVQTGRLAEIFYGEVPAQIEDSAESKNELKNNSKSLYLPSHGVQLASSAWGSLGAAPTSVHSLKLHEVVVGYKGLSPLTRPFDFVLKCGETVVLKGHSGCGKSTFLEILAGLRAVDAKTVQCDDPHGQTVALFNIQSAENLYLPVSWSTFVEQRPYLFEGTVRENLVLGHAEEISDAELWKALAKVNLDHHVKRVGGLDYQLFDGGKNLSEGQRYRLGLARTCLDKRPFILVDEPFATLDDFSATIVCQTLGDLAAAGHGVVIVSHAMPVGLKYSRLISFDALSNLSNFSHFSHFSNDRQQTDNSSHLSGAGHFSSVPKEISHPKAPKGVGSSQDSVL